MPASLIESELFGREKGAYTGALSREIGRFETANGGTLFLDEIGDLPLELQAKLLRVLETGTFERLGSSRTVKVDVRLIAATNRDLDEAVRERRFREDLVLPPAGVPRPHPAVARASRGHSAARVDVRQAVRTATGEADRKRSAPSMESLQAYHWPGNVRELRNVIERSMILTDGPTFRLTLPQPSAAEPVLEPAMTLEEWERRHILDMLERTGWRVSGPDGAARILGVKPTTLEGRMKKLGISRKRAFHRPAE